MDFSFIYKKSVMMFMILDVHCDCDDLNVEL